MGEKKVKKKKKRKRQKKKMYKIDAAKGCSSIVSFLVVPLSSLTVEGLDGPAQSLVQQLIVANAAKSSACPHDEAQSAALQSITLCHSFKTKQLQNL